MGTLGFILAVTATAIVCWIFGDSCGWHRGFREGRGHTGSDEMTLDQAKRAYHELLIEPAATERVQRDGVTCDVWQLPCGLWGVRVEGNDGGGVAVSREEAITVAVGTVLADDGG